MRTTKKAFILMPFKYPYDSYYPAIFKPALESLGYTVARADDLFSPRPIMLDIQKALLGADLILCEMSEKNPNVFYELGLSHAIGKPVILISQKKEDIPFDLRHIRVILYDYSAAGWEERLRDDIKAAALTVEKSDEIWPPPLVRRRDEFTALRGIASEIEFNLWEIDRFIAYNYIIEGEVIISKGSKGAIFRYITCMTGHFESENVQQSLHLIDDKTKSMLFEVYHSFREINNCADSLTKAFRPWRAQFYIEAVERFENCCRISATEFITKYSKMVS